MEHRWGKRLAVDIPIRLSIPLFTAKRGRLTDVSLSGGFIKTDAQIRVLSRLQVIFEGSRRTNQDAVAIHAYVARKADQGLGVEWCEFAPARVAELMKLTSALQLQPDRRVEELLSSARIAVGAVGRQKHGT